MKINGTVKWASVQEPNTKYDPKWCVNIYPSKQVVSQLKKQGFVIKNDEDGDFIHVKRSCITRAGKNMDAPNVVGRNPKVKFTELIGNGSEVNVLFGEYDVDGKKYGYLNAVQVLKHVPYGESFDDVSDPVSDADEFDEF